VIEKAWTVLGSKFGADQGKKALIVCTLYGLKSPSKNVWEAVMNYEIYLKENFGGKYCFSNRAENPLRTECAPEMDIGDVLGPEMASYYLLIFDWFHTPDD